MLNGLYFPFLRPRIAWVQVVRGLPVRLAAYGVDEDEPASTIVADGWETRLVAPLGVEGPRFRALLKEMTGREAEFFRGQLLAQASRSGRDRDESSGWNLVSALHRAGKADGGGAVSRDERLWQARLFLKLAEAVGGAEEEVRLGLLAVARKQTEMLRALQGEDDEGEGGEFLTPEELLPPAAKPFRVRELLAAWGALYLQEAEPLALLLTDEPEAAALLVEEVEGRAPGRVFALPELALGGDTGDPPRLSLALGELLAGRVEAGRAALAPLAEKSRVAGGGTVVQLQLLPGREFRRTLAEMSGLADGIGATAPFVLLGWSRRGTDSTGRG